MSSDIVIINILIWIHFIFDFVFQSDKMAINKSTSFKWLSLHCLVYSIGFFILMGTGYALINGIAHFIIDAISSRITSKFWKANERHWFFVTIGFDQALHISILLITYNMIY